MSSTSREDDVNIPDVIKDLRSGTTYIKGRFFGKGGFAKCYELTNCSDKTVWAGKIVSKRVLVKSDQKEKMTQEIEIHKSLKHKHVVSFHSFFDDANFVYIILELCKKRSMMELHKRRKALTEPEVRFFMKQIFDGVLYLHNNSIIHRDLKLGNIFLNEKLDVKIGDFGLAAKIQFSGQRKKTLCGTPNYIAPEILNKKGHSYEVDVWSLGCIMYTFLIGKPPFETSSLRETYAKIKRCEYVLPPSMNNSAAHMIHQMLQPEPSRRPPVKALLEMEFLRNGYCPKELPVSCLTMAPRFDTLKDAKDLRKPLGEINQYENKLGGPRQSIMVGCGVPSQTNAITQQCTSYMRHLQELLKTLLSRKMILLPDNDKLLEEISDPAAQPFVWVSKWVDYSDKYGFGYQLVDDGVGVMFNDNTRLVLLANQRNVHYIERDGTESYHIMGSTPTTLDKKMKLLTYFRRYMNEHLMKAGGTIPLQESDSLSRIPYLHAWHRSSSSVIMQLTNGTVQINFMDHTKIIMCPLLEAVTFIDLNKNFRTFRFTTLAEKGCVSGLNVCLEYAYRKITALLDEKKVTAVVS